MKSLLASDKPVDEQARINQLVQLLEFEIDQIRADERQPGWTRWAIFGALTSLTWLAINQIEAYRLGATNAVFVVI